MRRKFKPSLRHELKVAVTAPRPEPDQEFEIVVNDGHDTVLHYEGSPLVDTSLVADPDPTVALTKGENNSYESEDWICVGLATDNVEDASNELVDRGPNTGNPEDGSGGIYQPVIGSFANGLKYTQIGPSRSVLMFDLSEIPANATITEAILELTPDEDRGDVFSQQTVDNVWPEEGVKCEVLNLPTDTESSCTWNTKSNATITVNGIAVPDPSKRWWRGTGGHVLPNAIGVAQNTRRNDIPEPVEKFVEQRTINEDDALEINGTDGDEFYGHIGYGISGGGYALNVDPASPSTDTFFITKNQWDEKENSGVFSVDVKDTIEYAINNQGGQCNMLIRAYHWDKNTIAQPSNVDDQLTFPEETINELQFTTAYLSDSAGAAGTVPEISEINADQTLHVATDIINATNVIYQWQVELPYVQMDEITDSAFSIINTPTITEGMTFQFDHGNLGTVPTRRGVTDILDNDTFTVEYSIGGSPVADFSWQGNEVPPDGIITIPDNSGGENFRAKLTISNSVDTGDGSTDSVEFEQTLPIGVDGVGSFTYSITPDISSIDERETARVDITSVTGVSNPTFDYIWTKSFSPLQETLNTSQLFDEAVVPDVSAGIPNILRLTINMYENGVRVQQVNDINWVINNVDVPPFPSVNGSYSVTNMKVKYNTGADEIDAFGNPVNLEDDVRMPDLKSSRVTELTPPIVCDSSNHFKLGTPFGKKKVSGEQTDPIDIVPGVDDLACYVKWSQAAFTGSLPQHGLFNSGLQRMNGDFQNDSGVHERVDLITFNGLNSIVSTTSGVLQAGSLAIWFPNLSGGRWVVFNSRGNYPLYGAYPESGVPLEGIYARVPPAGSSSSTTYRTLGSEGGADDCDAPANQSIGWTVSTESSLELADWLSYIGDPESSTDFGEQYFVFFDDILTSSETTTVESSVLSDYVSSSGPPSGSGEISLPNASVASPSNPDAGTIGVIGHLTYKIDNFTDTNQPLQTSNSTWLVPSNVTVDESSGGGYLRGSLATDELKINSSVTVPRFKDISGKAGTAFEGIEYKTVQFAWSNKTDNANNWTGYSAVSMGYILPFIVQNIPSDKKYVVEVIRDGEVVGRNEYVLSSGDSAGKIGVMYADNGRYDDQYRNDTWQENDLLVISIINKNYNFAQENI